MDDIVYTCYDERSCRYEDLIEELQEENKRLKEQSKPRYVEGKRFTHCIDSYGTRIYEGDEILDEVGGFTDFVVYYKGTWYLGDKDGYTLSGQLLAHLQRKCKVVENGR